MKIVRNYNRHGKARDIQERDIMDEDFFLEISFPIQKESIILISPSVTAQ